MELKGDNSAEQQWELATEKRGLIECYKNASKGKDA